MRALVPFLALLVAGCSAAGSGSSGGSGLPPPDTGPPNPPPVGQSCSLTDRQQWAAAQIREWHLYPELIPATLDPSGFGSVDAYVDALTATARAQRRDRFWTYLTSIAEEDAFQQQGRTAAFGIRIRTDSARGVVDVLDSFETGPALAAGIDRGTRILAIGPSSASLRSVAALIAEGGQQAVSDAFGPAEPGVVRAFEIRDDSGTRVVTVTKASFDIPAVSPRFGVRILSDGGTPVGYVNLRTFIQPANAALTQAFAQFRAAGVRHVIVDVRYNSGGLVSTAELLGDLLGGGRLASDVFAHTVYSPLKSSLDRTRRFQARSDSVTPLRISFITTSTSASASELVANSMLPWLRAGAGLIGDNSTGKPVGQVARDRSQCDDRLRIVAFRTENADRRGDYFDGLAPVFDSTCTAADDIDRPMGDPAETMTRVALDHLAGRPCLPIPIAQPLATAEAEPLLPRRPTAAQREMPGTF